MELRDRDFILIDCETTGLDSKKHQILSIGILVISNMEIVDEIELKIKHKEYIVSTKALEVNKIDLVKHDEEAMIEEEAAKEMLKFLYKNLKNEGFIVIGQNVDFDIRFIEEMFLRCRRIKDYRKAVSYRKLDLMQVALIKNIEGKVHLDNQHLSGILKALELEFEGEQHTALADCKMTYKALCKLLSL